MFNKDKLGLAFKRTLGATSESYGTDCVLYAKVGAIVLNQLGLKNAKAVSGEAIWRVGEGDGDVISHSISSMNSSIVMPSEAKAAGMFHAWIECDDEVIDFTTFSLRAKAKILDMADGGKTSVDWCPEYLWVKKSSCSSLQDVMNSWDFGVYAYVRVPEKESELLATTASLDETAASVLNVYRMLESGVDVNVLAIDEKNGGFTDVAESERNSLNRKFHQISLQQAKKDLGI